MKVHYTKESDMLLIRLSETASDESEEIAPGVVFDFSASGSIVGIEVFDASQKMDIERLLADNEVERKNVTATRKEWAEIDERAQEVGMSRSAYLVHSAMGANKPSSQGKRPRKMMKAKAPYSLKRRPVKAPEKHSAAK